MIPAPAIKYQYNKSRIPAVARVKHPQSQTTTASHRNPAATATGHLLADAWTRVAAVIVIRIRAATAIMGTTCIKAVTAIMRATRIKTVAAIAAAATTTIKLATVTKTVSHHSHHPQQTAEILKKWLTIHLPLPTRKRNLQAMRKMRVSLIS
ncbi:hypothetical protein BJV82DRAFT_628214 [Fennellomyces sp. T-0311]|nr:hypothetical protein BJV82DRAFT_628214 [Fennellomyces sp. T-0311]